MNDTHIRKGILLAGGAGTRLYPLTLATSKQLLPIYDKPMVYYPLSVLIEAGIREVLVISSPADIGGFRRLLGDGSRLGMTIEYAVQPRPEGLAQAFVIGRQFVGRDGCALALGDNVLYGDGLAGVLASAARRQRGATIFGYAVNDPERYGVVQFDSHGNPLSLEEKPRNPRSTYAVPGLYFYDNRVLEIAGDLVPSARGELEITDLNRAYLALGELHAELLDSRFTWLDAGTPETLLSAAQFVRTMERSQGINVGCVEEAAFRSGFIDAAELARAASSAPGRYGDYLRAVATGSCRNRKLAVCG